MTRIIGLTGGIGSGKSSIASYIRSLGIPVYIADDASREMMNKPEIQKQVRQIFGESVFDGRHLDRQQLARQVFNDPKKLKQLNSIIHPAVRDDFEQWRQKHTDAPIIVKEAAILFESGSYKDCDSVITVTAPKEVRIERVMHRDKISRERVLERMQNQWTDEQRFAKSDYVVENTDLEDAKNQTSQILKKLMNF